MFFSKEQIEQSLKRLEGLNPFFGTVFLAFKKADVPVGKTKNLKFSQIVGDILRTYYRPTADFSDFYIPFSTANKSRGWYTTRYGSTLQTISNKEFGDAFMRADNKNEWGWHPDYINILEKKHLFSHLIPAFDLAVWLFRSRQWDKNIESNRVIESLLAEFNIDDEERVLFDTTSPALAHSWLHETAVNFQTLESIIGKPELKITIPAVDQRSQTSLPFELSYKPSEAGATLRYLKLEGTGPAEHIEMDFSKRLNIITGDNGLGKTFLLECAWWALTRNWIGDYQAYPHRNIVKNIPSISFNISNGRRSDKAVIRYNWERQNWIIPSDRTVLPGLTIYVKLDGTCIVWDPAKHLLADEDIRYSGRSSEAFTNFTRAAILDGVRENEGGKLRVPCNGLIYDWVYWQNADRKRFEQFTTILNRLSPHPTKEPLVPGKPTRIPLDAREIPTLRFPYEEVPIIVCSAGIQRIISLAYVLVWAWEQHVITSQQSQRDPQNTVVLLIDEMESHLHPQWQRTIVPALIDVMQALSSEVQVQMIVATHSPLVLASVEPLFDSERDSLFHLHLDDGNSVEIDNVPFVKRGPVDSWLMSDIFGLALPRSRDAEDAIEAAKDLQLRRESSKEKVQEVSDQLIRVLAPDDEFWSRWKYFAEQRGVRFDARSRTTGA